MLENFKKYCKEKSIDFFLPISFVLAIIPLIVRTKKVIFDNYSADIMGDTLTYDLFSQNKALLLMIFSIILVGFFIVYRKFIFEKKDKIINGILICSFVFLVFTLISAVSSQYKQVAFWGVYNRAEGFVTYLCYFILFVYSIYTFKKTEDYKCLLNAILIVVFVNAFLGIFQFSGNDLIKTELGKLIVVPNKIIEETGGGNLSLLYEKGKLYGTLFHYNYVGSFAAIVIPILFTAMILEYDVMYKMILGCGFLSSIWLLLGSTSRAGLVGIFLAAAFAIFIFGKVILKNKKHLAIGIISIVVFIIGLNLISKGAVFTRVPSLFKDAASVFSNTNSVDYHELIPIKDIKNIDGTVDLVFENKTLKIVFKDSKYKFSCDGNEIKVNKGTDNYLLDSSDFSNLSFKLYKSSETSDMMDLLKLTIDNIDSRSFYFKADYDNNTIHLVSSKNFENIDLEELPSIGFKGKEKLGSVRGYIWSRSIPLLKDCFILGKGPDTYMLYFPQNDLLAKYYAYDNPNMFVDKPHNLYLLFGLNHGIIALLAFLAAALIYIIDSLKLYALKKEYNESQAFGIATFLGVIGYLGAGVFNDSVISVAPVFWIVFGVGIALNYINRKANNK